MGAVRARLSGALLLGAIVAGPAAVPAQDAPPAPDVVLLDVALPPYRTGTVLALRLGDRALLPVRAVLEILDVASSGTGPTVHFTRPKDRAAVDINADARTVESGRARQVLAPDRLVLRDAEVFLDAEDFSAALGVRAVIDWAALQVQVLGADSLPPVAAAHRRVRHERLLAAEPPLPPVDQRRALARPWFDGGTLDYLVTIPDARPIGEGTYLTTVGSTVLGGAVEAFVYGDLGARSHAVSGSWFGVWRDRQWLSQLRLGDGFGTGPRGRAVRGVTLTNAPFLRPLDFGVIPVRAAGDSTWEVESFVNGRLVRVDTLRGASDAVPIAARYGGNLIDLVARGPGGLEQRTQHFVSLTANEFLPAGRVEYGFSAGECRELSCDALANADVRVGVSRQVTVQGGAEWQRDSLTRGVARPYGAVSWLAHPALTATGLVLVGGEASGVVRYQPTFNRAAVVERTTVRRDNPFTRTLGRGAQERLNATLFWRPEWRREAAFVTASWRGEHGDAGRSDRARLGLGMRSAAGQIFPYVQLERTELPAAPSVARRAAGAALYSTPSPRWGSWLARTWGYVAAEWRDDGARSGSATLAQSVGNAVRVEVSVQGANTAPPLFTLRAYTDLPRARVITASQYDGLSGYQGTHQVQGALFVDANRRRIEASRGPLAMRGAIGGRVFLDLDANGELDGDDQPLEGVAVRVGSASTLTDAAGWYRVWDVLPFEPVRLEVEALTLASPLWVPLFERVEIEPTPSSVRRVDVPVLSGGVVEGRVVQAHADGTMTELAGVEVTLVRRGRPGVRSVTTFSDGGFVVLGVAPGTYDVRMGDARYALREAMPIEVRAVADGDRIRNLELVVAPRF